MQKRTITHLFTAATISLGAFAISTPSASAAPPAPQRVTICHATASATNTFVMITVDIASIVGTAGHGRSGINIGDIIPAFVYNTDEVYPGNGDQALLANGCNPTSPTGGGDYYF